MQTSIKYFVSILVIISNISLYAQEKVTISGTVENAEINERLAGANIYLKSNIAYGTMANENGEFSFKVPKNNISDNLIVSFIGYEEKIVPIVCNSNIDIEVKLRQIARDLVEVSVKARRIIAEEFTIKQIKKIEIYTDAASKADPLLAVNSMAASTTTDESANISLRGSSPAETGIFFDNVPIYDAVRFSQLNGIGTFSIFNTAIVERLHVFPSNPPLEFGNSTSGLISIHSEETIPENNINSMTASLASFGGLTSRKLGDNSVITVFSNYQPSFLLLATNKNSLKALVDFNTVDLGIHFIKNFNKTTSFKLFNYANIEGYDYNLRHPSFIGVFNQHKKRNFTVTNFTKSFDNSELTINNGFSFSKSAYKYSNTDIGLNNRDLYFSVNYFKTINKINIKTGFTFDSRHSEIAGDFPMYNYAFGEKHPVIGLDTSYLINIPEIYVYGKYKISDKWILGGGLRKNIPANNQKHYLSEQLNIHYNLNKNHSLNISAGSYHKYNLPTGQSHNISYIENKQISLDYKYLYGNYEIASAIFVKKSKIDNYDGEIFGVEIYTKFQISDHLFGNISYTYLDAIITKDGENVPGEYDMNYFIRGTLKYKFNNNIEINSIFIHRQGTHYFPVSGSNFNNEFDVYEPIYSGLENIKRLPDYSVFDLSITKMWLINEDLILIPFFNISNFFNHDNVREINYSKDYSEQENELFSKRTIYFGVVINF